MGSLSSIQNISWSALEIALKDRKKFPGFVSTQPNLFAKNAQVKVFLPMKVSWVLWLRVARSWVCMSLKGQLWAVTHLHGALAEYFLRSKSVERPALLCSTSVFGVLSEFVLISALLSTGPDYTSIAYLGIRI